jgi:triacylglycerol lipase
MPYALVPDAGGDPKNAAACAMACTIAYLPEPEGQAAFQSEFGMTAKLINVLNTQAYVAGNDNHILVAFRGSESPTSIDGLKDWFLTNAMNLLILPEGPLGPDFSAAGAGARFHQGFVSAITAIWDPLFAEIEAQLKAKDRLLWVTGHSLGGALALMAAWLLLRKTVAVHQIYTFGAPMVGNKEVADAFAREYPGQIFRYVNGPDPIPLLPMMSLVANDFSPCDKLMMLGEASEAANLIDYLKGAAGDAWSGLLTGDVQEKVWGGIKTKIGAHFMDGYRKHWA